MAVAAFTALVQTVVTIAGGGALAYGSLTGFTAFLAYTATYAVLGAVSRELFAQPSLDTMNGINFNVRDPAATRKMIYGKCRVGGAIVFFNTSDTDNNYLHLVIAVAGHEIEGYEQVYFGDIKVWENGSYIDDGTTDWEDHCLLSFHKGDQTAADSTLVDAATGFTSDHKLLGTAYVYVRLDYNAEVYVSGVPNISFVVKGKKVLDPRDSTTAYSNNPALIAYDYLLDTQYGLGESAANINTASVIASANICDATVTITGGSQKAFECDGVLDSGTNIKVNLESILSSMIGTVSYYNGKFSIIAHNHYTPVASAIDTSMIVSPIQVSTKRSRKSQHNTVKGQFISEENDYVVADYPIQKNASYITQDGQEMPLNLTLAMTTNNVRAQRIAKLVMEKSRQQMTISLELNLSGLKYAVGDNIKINYERFSWTNKEFEVTSLQLLPDPERGLIVAIQAVENNTSAYTWVAGDASAFVVAPQVDVYKGTTVIAPTNIRVYGLGDEQDGQFRLMVAWDGVEEVDGAVPYEPYLSHYEITVTDNAASDIKHQSYETILTQQEVMAYYVTMRSGTFSHTVRVRAVNLRGYKSAELVFSGIDRTDVFPDLPNNLNRVFGTYAEPTAAQLTELAEEAGIEVVDGVEILYIQIDASGIVLNSQEYVFDAVEMKVEKNTNFEQIINTVLAIDPVRNGDFTSQSNWTLNNPSWTISNGRLNANSALSNHMAYQQVSSDPVQKKLSFSILDITNTLVVSIYSATTYQELERKTYTAIGDETFNYTPDGSHMIVFSGYDLAPTSCQIDNVTLLEPLSDAGHKHRYVATTYEEVNWSYIKSDQVNMSDTGVSENYVGFTGTNLRREDGRPYVEVSISRSSSSVGQSRQRVKVTADWNEDATIDGTPVTVAKSSSKTILYQVEVA